MKSIARVLLGFALLAGAGCGQKGPLYLPDEAGSVVTKPAEGASTPANDTKKEKPTPNKKADPSPATP